MNDQKFEAANQLFARPEAQTYQSDQQRILDTLARLRAERLARQNPTD